MAISINTKIGFRRFNNGILNVGMNPNLSYQDYIISENNKIVERLVNTKNLGSSVSYGKAFNGKRYFEVKAERLDQSFPFQIMVGWCDGVDFIQNNENIVGFSTKSVAWSATTGRKYVNGSWDTYIGEYPIAANDIIMCCIDVEYGHIWYGKNGVWFTDLYLNEGDPSNSLYPHRIYSSTFGVLSIYGIHAALSFPASNKFKLNLESSDFVFEKPNLSYSIHDDIQPESISFNTLDDEKHGYSVKLFNSNESVSFAAALNSESNSSALAKYGKNGKGYFEVKYRRGGDLFVGVATESHNTSYYIGYQNSIGWQTSTLRYWRNSTWASVVGSHPEEGDIIMVAFDSGSGKIWFGMNGTWFNSGNPSSGVGEVTMLSSLIGVEVFPAVSLKVDTLVDVYCRSEKHTYEMPSGFSEYGV